MVSFSKKRISAAPRGRGITWPDCSRRRASDTSPGHRVARARARKQLATVQPPVHRLPFDRRLFQIAHLGRKTVQPLVQGLGLTPVLGFDGQGEPLVHGVELGVDPSSSISLGVLASVARWAGDLVDGIVAQIRVGRRIVLADAVS